MKGQRSFGKVSNDHLNINGGDIWEAAVLVLHGEN